MAIANHVAIERWAGQIHGPAESRSMDGSSVFAHGDSIYSYGTHFEMARIMRDKHENATFVLVNGDRYSVTTSGHQSNVRNELGARAIPTIIVPFSALQAAGVALDTIRPLEVRDDRFTHEERSSERRPADLTWMEDPSGATTTEKRYGRDERGEWGMVDYERPVMVEDPVRTASFGGGTGWSDGAELGDDERWHWTVRRHWLGDSLFRARVTVARTRKPTEEELAQHEASLAWQRKRTRLANRERELRFELRQARYKARTGDSFYTAKLMILDTKLDDVECERYSDYNDGFAHSPLSRDGRVVYTVRRWATFLSSFDYQEARPLYFLCELPYRCEARTVEEAVEALKSPEVVAAEARGLKVTRQGDLFAIPTRLTKRQLRRMQGRRDFEKRLRVLGTNHSVTEGIVCKGGAAFGRGTMRHEPDFGRQPDHARKKMGDGKSWHLLVRNTVPRARA